MLLLDRLNILQCGADRIWDRSGNGFVWKQCSEVTKLQESSIDWKGICRPHTSENQSG